jgi:ribosomal protein S8E
VVLNVHTTAKSENLNSVARLQTPSSGLSAYTQFVSAAATTNTVRYALIPAILHGALNMSHAKHALLVSCVSFFCILLSDTKIYGYLEKVYNASNNELVRTNTLVKGAIIQVDATPFRVWYEAHVRLFHSVRSWSIIDLRSTVCPTGDKEGSKGGGGSSRREGGRGEKVVKPCAA